MFISKLQQFDLCNSNIFNLKFFEKDKEKIFISHTIFKYLNKSKKKIDECQESWATIKKYTNEYEYIHTPLSINKPAISKIKPLSRAFFGFV